ncbi:MAG: hypothetical protein ACI8R8_002875, partial [Paraglaciecola sp.]
MKVCATNVFCLILAQYQVFNLVAAIINFKNTELYFVITNG